MTLRRAHNSDNHVTWLWPFDLKVNALWAMWRAKVGADSSSRLSFRARTHTQSHRRRW